MERLNISVKYFPDEKRLYTSENYFQGVGSLNFSEKPGCEYFTKALSECGEIEYFSKIFSGCGEFGHFRKLFPEVGRLNMF